MKAMKAMIWGTLVITVAIVGYFTGYKQGKDDWHWVQK